MNAIRVKCFSLKKILKLHEKSHNKEKPFECELCLKKFATLFLMNLHKNRIHSNNKPFECRICGRKFKTSSELKSHEITLTNEKLHQCKICDKNFKHKQSLKLHQKIHSQ